MATVATAKTTTSQVIVFSKCPNDVEFCSFEHRKNNEGKTMHSIPIHKVVIQGLNKYCHQNKRKLVHADMLAQTVVDGSLWDSIMKERGEGDWLLRSKQIFAAKSETEAYAMVKDVERGISDPYTDAEFARKREEAKAKAKEQGLI